MTTIMDTNNILSNFYNELDEVLNGKKNLDFEVKEIENEMELLKAQLEINKNNTLVCEQTLETIVQKLKGIGIHEPILSKSMYKDA
jgi:hypothetical protein